MWTAWAATLPLLLSTAPDAEPEPSVNAGASLRFEREELEAVPSVLAGPLAVLPTFPGASPLLSPLPVSSIRGLQPSTVGILFDDVRLPTAFHLLIGPAVLQESMVSSLTYPRGAPPIAHRGMIGGALAITPTTPSVPGVHGESAIDLLRLGALAHFRTSDGATAVSAAASVAWTPWLYTRVAGPASPSWAPDRPGLQADLYDYYARGEHRVGDGALRVLAIGSVDAGGTASETDLLGAELDFHRIDLRLTQPLRGGARSSTSIR